MRLEHPYCVVDQAFSGEVCQRIIDLGMASNPMTAEVARDPTNSVRDSTVAWLGKKPETEWLFELLTEIVSGTNARLWNWQISDVESMQFTSYGSEQHYSWHADQRRRPYPDDDKRWPGLLRKLSVTVGLSNAGDYEGGDFEIEVMESPPDSPERRLKTISDVRNLGTAVIFPSHLYHRVNAVTAGTRRSLVAWYLGPPFI